MHPSARTLLAAAATSWLAAALPAEPSLVGDPALPATCPALVAVTVNGGARILHGARQARPEACADGGAAAREGEPDPAWRGAGGLSADGGVTPPSSLGVVVSGLPVAHRGATWLLSRDGSRATYRFAPLPTEHGLTGSRVDRADHHVAHALARIDDWELALVEQVEGGRLEVARIATEGAALESSFVSQARVDPAWPEGSRLVGADAHAGRLVAFARAPDGAIHACDATTGAAVAHLAVAPGNLAAAALTGGGIAVAEGAPDGTLRVHAWDGRAWTERPADAPAGGPPDALIVVALGKDREDVAVAALVGHDFVTWRPGETPRREAMDGREGFIAPPPLRGTEREAPGTLSRVLPYALAPIGLVALIAAGLALSARHRRR